jgi:hypothetical protein
MPTAGSDWQNFLNWLNSPQGWLFWVLVLGLILSILVNLVVYARKLREGSTAEIGLGRILAVVGGFIALMAQVMPWESSLSPGPPCINCGYVAIGLNFGGLAGFMVSMSGLLWLVFFAIPKKVSATWGFIWGGLALLFALLALERIAADAATNVWPTNAEYGIYVSIVGSIALVIGSALAFLKAGKAMPPEPMPVAEAPPSIP